MYSSMIRLTKSKQLVRLLVVVVMLWMAVVSSSVSGQFFTKSSKSIPRMGRRSPPTERLDTMQPLRRLLIDSLLDQYGPKLADAIEARANAIVARQDDEAKLYQQASGQGGSSSGEFVLPNEQPYSIRALAPMDLAELRQNLDQSAAPSANSIAW